ncbi:hypothetical protein IWQ61_007332 [Dispira simplex]|nr:hypothetical protein IWQ61_007332 [Dispira simplex]
MSSPPLLEKRLVDPSVYSPVREKADDFHQDIDPDEDSPFEMVRAAVGNRDNPQLPTLTFRVWLLGIMFTLILSFTNQFFWFRDNPITLEVILVQLLCYPLGRLCEFLPTRRYKLFNRYEFSLNPGQFSIKEHVLITAFANAGAGTAYAIDIVVIKKLWYKSAMGAGPSLLLLLSSQLIGYGLAGIVREFLVRPAAMVWPATLVNVVLFRTLHGSDYHEETKDEPFGCDEAYDDISGLTKRVSYYNRLCGFLRRISTWSRIKFFWVFFTVSFVYYFFPGYLFTTLASIPLLCLVAPHNVVANQLGDGLRGLGLLSFTFDWTIVSSSYLHSPMATPFWAACNMFFGFMVVMWIVVPIGYYSNLWGSAYLPIYTAKVYDTSGQLYDINRILPDGHYDEIEYQSYGPLRITFQFALVYGMGFAALASVLSYIALHHGKEIWQRIRQAHLTTYDIHAKLMRRYPEVPALWYITLFLINIAVAIILCEVFDVELPWWGLLLAVAVSALFIVPIGVIQAVTNQQPGLNIITEFIIGLIMPGKPIANVTFKTYGYITMSQGLSLVQDLKLGHYMKIPPRHMFICQTFGTILAAMVQLLVAFWLMDSVEDICTDKGYPWTCRGAETFYSASVIWGLIGPAKMFGPESPYHPTLWFFLAGFLLPFPFYYLQKRYPGSWIQYIHIPLILSALSNWPPAPAMDYPMWFFYCFIFNFVVHRYRQGWWNRYTFTLSAALDAGVAIGGVLVFFMFYHNGLEISWWGNQSNLCPHGRDSFLTPSPHVIP